MDCTNSICQVLTWHKNVKKKINIPQLHGNNSKINNFKKDCNLH